MKFDKEQVIGKWLSIFRNLGIEVDETGRHSKCPLCGREGTKGIRVTDNNGSGSWICCCGNGDGWDLIQQKFSTDFKGAVEVVAEVIGHSEYIEPMEKKKITSEDLRKMFIGAERYSEGDHVDEYLGARGLTARPEQNIWCHKAAWHSETRNCHPAMFALFTDKNGMAVSFHRTYLDGAGGKLEGVDCNKKMSPALVDSLSGGAVRLFPHEESSVLGIAEGIETALAAYQDFAVPFWAATTAILLEKWVPPENITDVVIVGDNDRTFTGQAAAYSLAKRLVISFKKNISVYIPEITGSDWLDMVVTCKSVN